MQPAWLYVLTIVGLCFDLADAFFLSIEAIKIENVRRLNNWSTQVGSEEIIMTLTSAALKALIRWDRAEISKVYRRVSRYRTWKLYLYWEVLLLVPLVPIALFMAALITARVFSPPPIAISLVRLFRTPVLISLALIFLILQSVRIFFLSGRGPELRALIKFLNFIEGRTPTGFLGLVGLVCLLVGFIMQALTNVLMIVRAQ